jgi:hypothetical protein
MDSGYTFSFQPLSASLGASYIRGWVDLENVKKFKNLYSYYLYYGVCLSSYENKNWSHRSAPTE